MESIIQSAYQFHKQNNFDQASGIHIFYKYHNDYFLLDPDATIVFTKYLNSYSCFCQTVQFEDENIPNINYLMFPEEYFISLIREIIVYDKKSLELYTYGNNEIWNLFSKITPFNLNSKIEIIKNLIDISKSRLLLAISAIPEDNKFSFSAICCDPVLSKIGSTDFIDSLPSLMYYDTLILQIFPCQILLVDVPQTLKERMMKIASQYGIPVNAIENTEQDFQIEDYANLQLLIPQLLQALIVNYQINPVQFTLKPFELIFMSFSTVQFRNCRIQTDVKYCSYCSLIVEEMDLRCPKCNARYEDQLIPIWRFYFTIDKQFVQSVPIVEATGPILDPVIGFTIEDYLYLKETMPHIDWDMWICKYFVGVPFLITQSFKRIKTINLEKGNKITFREWINLMSDTIGVNKETIDMALIERYMNEDE